MKTLRTILIIFIISIFASGCAAKHQFNTEGQNRNSAVADTDVTNESPLGSILTGEESIKPYSPAKNTGSAKELIGDILVVSIFMEDSEAKITPQLENEILAELHKAGNWLENEAKGRGKTTKIITGKDDSELIIKYTHPKVIIADNGLLYDDILYIMKELKMDSYYNKIAQKYNTENIAFMFHCNKNGRSNAYPGSGTLFNQEHLMSGEASEANYLYFDICFVYSMMNWETTQYSVYAHELLHLFGAVDLYYSDLFGDERGENAVNMHLEKQALINKYCPNEIMYNATSHATICDLTAYLVGWKETVPIKYVYFLYNS